MMDLNYFLFTLLVFRLANTSENVRDTSVAQNQTVFQRELCVKKATKVDILNNYNTHYAYKNNTRVMTNILGFLDIKNKNSYLEATKFAYKFSMLTPFHLEIRRIGREKYKITGPASTKTTRKWVRDLLKTHRETNILALITFPDWTLLDLLNVVSSYSEMIKLSTELLEVCDKYELDGIVLDMWREFYGKIPVKSMAMVIQQICGRLRMEFKLAIVLIPTAHSNEAVITPAVFEIIADYASYVIFEMVDYSLNAGPISPIDQIENFVKFLTPDPLIRRTSIIIGINFFGKAYTTLGPIKITGDKFIELLEKYPGNELEFDKEAKEHYFMIKSASNEEMSLYYPTLFSLYSRVKLANKLGISLAVINLGDGLEYFYDVL